MTIDQLQKYRDTCAEIDDIEQELNSSHYVADTVTTCTPPSYVQHRKVIGGYMPDGNTVSKLARLSALKERQRAVNLWVERIPTHNIRKAVKTYYLEPIEIGESKPTWESVADEVGNGVTSASLKMALRRLLKKTL